jgi:hypothetical protein
MFELGEIFYSKTNQIFELTSVNNPKDKIQIEILIIDPNLPLEPPSSTPQKLEEEKKVDEFPHHTFIHGTRIFGRSSLSKSFRALMEDTPILEGIILCISYVIFE